MKTTIVRFGMAIAIAAVGFLNGNTAQATSEQSGYNVKVWIDPVLGVYFELVNSTTRTGKPTCANGNNRWSIVDETSDIGKQQLAMLLSANANGKTIDVIGASSECSRSGTMEDVRVLYIAP